VTFVDELKEARSHDVEFDARNLSSGIYFYRIQASGFSQIKRLILIR